MRLILFIFGLLFGFVFTVAFRAARRRNQETPTVIVIVEKMESRHEQWN